MSKVNALRVRHLRDVLVLDLSYKKSIKIESLLRYSGSSEKARDQFVE